MLRAGSSPTDGTLFVRSSVACGSGWGQRRQRVPQNAARRTCGAIRRISLAVLLVIPGSPEIVDTSSPPPAGRVGWLARILGNIGAWIIYRLIAIFGRTRRWVDVPWLAGPMGDSAIGDAPYREVA